MLREWTKDDLDPPPLLIGEDLIQAGLKPGPIFKKLLDAVREAHLESTIGTPKEAWELVERLLAEWGETG